MKLEFLGMSIRTIRDLEDVKIGQDISKAKEAFQKVKC